MPLCVVLAWVFYRHNGNESCIALVALVLFRGTTKGCATGGEQSVCHFRTRTKRQLGGNYRSDMDDLVRRT